MFSSGTAFIVPSVGSDDRTLMAITDSISLFPERTESRRRANTNAKDTTTLYHEVGGLLYLFKQVA